MCRWEGGDCGFCVVVVDVEVGIIIEGILEIVKVCELLLLILGLLNENWKVLFLGWFFCCRVDGVIWFGG